MPRPQLEVGDIFRNYGDTYRRRHAGHLSLGQLKVLTALERCRTRVLGGHRLRCSDTACGAVHVAYNSCRNRHCPKCQGRAAEQWLEARQAELLPIGYFHAVFTVPAEIADIAYHNKAVVYDLMFKAMAQAVRDVAATHLKAQLGITAVLHSWGSALVHHPHIHCIVSGGGLSLDGRRWIASRRRFLLPVKVLSRRFRTLLLKALHQAHRDGRLQFFGGLQTLVERQAFQRHLAPITRRNWYLYVKAPFAGPEAVLHYLGRYTHRVALANSRLIRYDGDTVTFWRKHYRGARVRHSPITLDVDEFLRRFLLHVLPKGFHRIRHYGLFARHLRADNLEKIHALLGQPTRNDSAVAEHVDSTDPEQPRSAYRCPVCGAPMRIIETFEPLYPVRAPPRAAIA